MSEANKERGVRIDKIIQEVKVLQKGLDEKLFAGVEFPPNSEYFNGWRDCQSEFEKRLKKVKGVGRK